MTLSLRPSLNWLLVFVPVSAAMNYVGGVPSPVLFFDSSLSGGSR
jgi:hypothetical protein